MMVTNLVFYDYHSVVWKEDSWFGYWDSHYIQNQEPVQLTGAVYV